jgi:HEAT repeat protein
MVPARLPSFALLLALSGLAAGCQDGPIPENRVLNPWAREQWAEDEKFGPTYYKRLDELAAVRARAAGLPEDERQRLAAEIIEVFAEEPSAAMRAELVRTLAYLPGSTAQAGLGAALTDADADVRVAVCQGLGRMRSGESLALLAKTVESDEELDVRIAAVRSLGSYEDAAALPSLGIALEDANPAVQKAAIESLAATTGRDYGNSVPAWKEFLAGGNPTKPPGPSLAERLGWPWY